MRVTKEVTFEAAHRLLHHKGLCHNLHGHSYRVACTFEGAKQHDTNMVEDFAVLKGHMNAMFAKDWDHSVLLNSEDPLLPILQEQRMIVHPIGGDPTAEKMAYAIKTGLNELLETSSIKCVEVTVWETPTNYATA